MVVEVGDLVALASALGWAGTTAMARHISRSISTLWYNALRVGIGALVMLALSPWTLPRADLANVSMLALSLLLVSVLTGFAVGDTAFFEAMRRIGVARASPIAGCHPLVTALLAVVLLGEPITLTLVLGVVVIGVGVGLITPDRVDRQLASGSAATRWCWVSVSRSWRRSGGRRPPSWSGRH